MNKYMKALGVFGLAAALSAGSIAVAPTEAKADSGKFVTGLIIGGAAGAILNEHHRDYRQRRHYRARAHRGHGSRHVNWCHSRYRSYDARSNTWVSYSGDVRQCRSPYWG
ncbi:BA14K family protein [Tepidamorphus sp. 3E244]|uniref:BA14K family protein n=1 Tax=Tepidamorphus sp. 3E244 TaxID=3385498 RepID=UPI0038FCEB0C